MSKIPTGAQAAAQSYILQSALDRIRLWMLTQSLNYSRDGRTHHYVEHHSPMMSHLQIILYLRLDIQAQIRWILPSASLD